MELSLTLEALYELVESLQYQGLTELRVTHEDYALLMRACARIDHEREAITGLRTTQNTIVPYSGVPVVIDPNAPSISEQLEQANG